MTLRKVLSYVRAVAIKLPSVLAKDKVLTALVLALVVALVLALAKRAEAFDPNMGMQHWGCPKGQVEYEKGCYDPKTKMYKAGKHIVNTKLA